MTEKKKWYVLTGNERFITSNVALRDKVMEIAKKEGNFIASAPYYGSANEGSYPVKKRKHHEIQKC